MPSHLSKSRDVIIEFRPVHSLIVVSCTLPHLLPRLSCDLEGCRELVLFVVHGCNVDKSFHFLGVDHILVAKSPDLDCG